jgi:RNA polymerase sigma-70 factor (ECF subfamily)
MVDPAALDEQALRASCERGEIVPAATAVIRAYGPEILGFLVAFHKDHDLAGDSFSIFAQRLWETLQREYQWRCSLRTWCYRLARNTAIDAERGEGRLRRRHVGLSSAPEVAALAARTRTETLSALRSENRTALEKLRDELPEEDRTLLVLRVDRGLEWREISVALESLSEDERDEEAIAREAARLRKRYQLIKERLRARARERGLLR